MKINLSNYETIPTLVNGKVVVLNCPYGKVIGTIKGKSVSTFNFGRYTDAPIGSFLPEQYDILVTDNYDVIIDSKIGNIITAVKDYLVSEKVVTSKVESCNPYKVGDIVRLKNRGGNFRIVSVHMDTVTVICDKWKYKDKIIHFNEIKSLSHLLDWD
jgi:hypothetical protein